jgi:hypothetical protein
MTQTKQAKHTATSVDEWWKTEWEDENGCEYFLIRSINQTIASIPAKWTNAEAYADRIVRAVNSHEELLEALQKWADIIQGGDKLEKLEPWAQECVTEFRNAITRATGE